MKGKNNVIDQEVVHVASVTEQHRTSMRSWSRGRWFLLIGGLLIAAAVVVVFLTTGGGGGGGGY